MICRLFGGQQLQPLYLQQVLARSNSFESLGLENSSRIVAGLGPKLPLYQRTYLNLHQRTFLSMQSIQEGLAFGTPIIEPLVNLSRSRPRYRQINYNLQ